MYCLNLLGISLELAREDPVYEDIATKFFEHFVYIGAAVNRMGGGEDGLWSEADGFYFDRLQLPDGRCFPIAAHTIAGLIPVFAVAVADQDTMRGFTDFTERFQWFVRYRPELLRGLADITHHGVENRIRLALVDSKRLRRILGHMLDEKGLLSPHGVRSVSKRHAREPFVLRIDGQRFELDYAPGEATTGLFGGNSNWRGPVWLPLNYLLIEALQKHQYFLGDDYRVECPTGSGRTATLWEVTTELSYRLIKLFLRDENGRRPIYGNCEKFQTDPHWRDLVLFHEYFHGETGAGLGASHQTGWTGLVAKLIQQYAEYALQGKRHDLGSRPAAGEEHAPLEGPRWHRNRASVTTCRQWSAQMRPRRWSASCARRRTSLPGASTCVALHREIDGQDEAQHREEYRQRNRIDRVVRARNVRGWQRPDVAPVLERAEDHASGADQHQRDADDAGDVVRRLQGRARGHVLRRQQPQEQSEPGDDEAEGHDRESGADPCQQRSFGGEKDAGVGHHAVVPSSNDQAACRSGAAVNS